MSVPVCDEVLSLSRLVRSSRIKMKTQKNFPVRCLVRQNRRIIWLVQFIINKGNDRNLLCRCYLYGRVPKNFRKDLGVRQAFVCETRD